jgi:hypothetical protein
MIKKSLVAFLKGKAVEIKGGYKHPQKGFFLEVSSKKVPTQSISIWELKYENKTEADKIFKKIFNVNFDAAIRLHLKHYYRIGLSLFKAKSILIKKPSNSVLSPAK